MNIAERVGEIEEWRTVTDFRLKELEKAEETRSRSDYVRDWFWAGGRYLIPLALALTTFLLGRYA